MLNFIKPNSTVKTLLKRINPLTLFLTLILFSSNLQAQSYLIGADGTQSYFAPVNRTTEYSACEIVYPFASAGFTTLGIIKTIGFHKTSGTNTSSINNVTVYMKMVAQNTTVSSTANISGYTLVYSGAFPNSAATNFTGTDPITLSTPFYYNDGTKDLSVLIIKGSQLPVLDFGTTPYHSISSISIPSISGSYSYYEGSSPWTSGITSMTVRNRTVPQVQFVLSSATQWTGIVNSDWSNASNWDNGVPNQNKSAIIPNVSTLPIVGTVQEVNDISVNIGASVTITGTLKIKGRITNLGLLIASMGSIEFIGSSTQSLDGNVFQNNSVKNLTINNSYQPVQSSLMNNSNVNGLFGIKYISTNKFIAVGNDGTVLKTIDGGTVWTTVSVSTTNHLRGVFNTDASTIFVCGFGGTILKSTNGGTTFSALTSGVTDDLFKIYFTSANIGYAIGSNGRIIYTNNGGTSWSIISSGVTASLFDLSFSSSSNGFICGENGIVLKTTNGGTTWVNANLQSSEILSTIVAIDNNTILATGLFSGKIYKSIDAGSNWNMVDDGPTAGPCSIKYFGNQKVVVTRYTEVLLSENSGTSWVHNSFSTFFNSYSSDFSDNTTGFLVGDDGKIVKLYIPDAYQSVSLTGNLTVTGTLTPTAGTLTTGGYLTLKSDASGTARIATGSTAGGYISGNVIAQRFIPSGSRKYRFLGHPFNAAMHLTEITDDIDITGSISGSNANAFTSTASGAASAFSYNESNGDGATNDAGWTAFTSGNSVSSIAQGQGTRILIRGSKGQAGSLTGGVYTPAAVTLGMTGTLKQGNFTQTLNYTSVSKGWNLISNPYASNIDWTTVTKTRVDNAVYTYRPALSGGTYASYINGSITNGGSQYIETGSAFFVRANAASPSLAWHEADKVSNTPTNSTFRTTAIHNRISLTLVNAGNQNTDEVVVRFGDDNATDGFDAKYDAMNLAGASHDLYVLDNQQTKYSIYHGSELSSWQTENRVVALGFANAIVGNYIIKAAILNEFSNGNKVWLKDAYTGTLTEINDNTSYTFQVTTDAASQGNSRFSLVFNPKEKIVTSIKELSIKLSPNPAKGLVQLTYSQVSELNTTISFISTEGKKVKSINLGKVQYGIEKIDISKLSKGVYYVQFDNGMETRTEKLFIQ